MLSIEDRKTLTFVCASLGPTLTAALCGAPSRRDVDAWAMIGRGSKTPTKEQLNRLRFAHEVFQRISTQESADIARAWFIGANVGEAGDTPLTGIREDRFVEVNASALRLIDGGWS